jgi:hypothetical protein
MGPQVKVLPNGVDLTKASRIFDIDVNFQNDAPVIGFLGSFEYFIDLDLIFSLASRLTNINFLLVGTGRDWLPFSKKIEQLGCRNVILTGGISHDYIFSYIDKMDICLNLFKKIPVSHAACPLKVFEYLAMRKPVISTRLDELDFVDNNFLYYVDSEEEIEYQIKNILANPEEAVRRANLGYETVKKTYTWHYLAREFEDFLMTHL